MNTSSRVEYFFSSSSREIFQSFRFRRYFLYRNSLCRGHCTFYKLYGFISPDIQSSLRVSLKRRVMVPRRLFISLKKQVTLRCKDYMLLGKWCPFSFAFVFFRGLQGSSSAVSSWIFFFRNRFSCLRCFIQRQSSYYLEIQLPDREELLLELITIIYAVLFDFQMASLAMSFLTGWGCAFEVGVWKDQEVGWVFRAEMGDFACCYGELTVLMLDFGLGVFFLMFICNDNNKLETLCKKQAGVKGRCSWMIKVNQLDLPFPQSKNKQQIKNVQILAWLNSSSYY